MKKINIFAIVIGILSSGYIHAESEKNILENVNLASDLYSSAGFYCEDIQQYKIYKCYVEGRTTKRPEGMPGDGIIPSDSVARLFVSYNDIITNEVYQFNSVAYHYYKSTDREQWGWDFPSRNAFGVDFYGEKGKASNVDFSHTYSEINHNYHLRSTFYIELEEANSDFFPDALDLAIVVQKENDNDITPLFVSEIPYVE